MAADIYTVPNMQIAQWQRLVEILCGVLCVVCGGLAPICSNSLTYVADTTQQLESRSMQKQ